MKIIDIIADFIKNISLDSTEVKDPRPNEIYHESKKDPNEKKVLFKFLKIKW